jgi:hypothetical protein
MGQKGVQVLCVLGMLNDVLYLSRIRIGLLVLYGR